MVGLRSLRSLVPPWLARKVTGPRIAVHSGSVPQRHRYSGRVATIKGSRGLKPLSLPTIPWQEVVDLMRGIYAPFPPKAVLGPCFSTGYTTKTSHSPRVPTAYGGRDAGGGRSRSSRNPC